MNGRMTEDALELKGLSEALDGESAAQELLSELRAAGFLSDALLDSLARVFACRSSFAIEGFCRGIAPLLRERGPMTSRPDKEFATLQAKAALRGVVLCRIEDDRGCELFIASKWNLTKHLATLEDVDAWLDRLAGSA